MPGDGAVDSNTVFALAEHGRVLHIVPADGLRTDADIIGREALCGQRVAREVHPSDHHDGGRVCRRCTVREQDTAQAATTDSEEIARIRRTSGDDLADLCALADDYLAQGPRFQDAVRAEVQKGLAQVLSRRDVEQEGN
jgi:hypothetical protein